ncbi:uncharacterized protein LOC144431917 [Styela clava]
MVQLDLNVERPSELIVRDTEHKRATEQNHRVNSRIPIFRTGRRSSREDRLSPNSLEVAFLSRKKGGNPKQVFPKKNPMIRRNASTNLIPNSMDRRKSVPEEMVLFENNMVKLPTDNTKNLKNIWTPKLKLLEEDSTKNGKQGLTKSKKVAFTKPKDEVRADFLENEAEVKPEDKNESENNKMDVSLKQSCYEDQGKAKTAGTVSIEFSNNISSQYSNVNTRFGAFHSLLGLIKQRASPVSLFSFMFMGRSTRNIKARYDTLENTSLTDEEKPAEIQWISIDSRECSPTPSEEEIRNNTWENATSIIYFRNLVSEAKEDMNKQCHTWSVFLNDDTQNLSGEVVGEIRSIIGQAQLLISERFTQFEELVTKFEKPTHDYEIVTSNDLEGFWEMITFQIKDIQGKFGKLQKIKENNWTEIDSKNATTRKTKKLKASGIKPPTKYSKSHKDEARKRLQEAKRAMQERTKSQSNRQFTQGDGMNEKLIIE